jgi:hypothetical protein
MREDSAKRRPLMATILALLLGWLGVAGVLNASIWPLALNSELMKSAPPQFIDRFPPALGSWWMSVLALAYGASALLAARALWRLSPSAVVSYLAWAATVPCVMAALSIAMPGIPSAAVVALLVPVLALLAAGWLLIRRLVQP